jgi:hypothetical protein
MAAGEGVAWYLNNRGWAVKTRDHLVIVDAEEFGVRRPADPVLANGFLTADELAGQNLLALYTCYHGDPGELAAVHELADRMATATYVHLREDRFRDGERCLYLGPGEEHTVGDVRMWTVEASMGSPAHAYVVHVDGLRLFYQGFEPTDAGRFVEDLSDLVGRIGPVDLAFLPAPASGSEGESFFTVLSVLRPGTLCLLDPDRREELFPEVARRTRDRGYTGEVFCAEEPGDMLTIPGSSP